MFTNMDQKIYKLDKIKNIFNLLRYDQWIKNLIIFCPILFLEINLIEKFSSLIPIFIIFILLSSSTYIVNDILDIEKDKINPFKKDRPLVNGSLNKIEAFKLLILINIVNFNLIYFFSSKLLNYIFITYIIVNLLYSFKLKEIFLIDILAVSSGYALRFISGFVCINQSPEFNLIAGIYLLSLNILVIKRKIEFSHKIFNSSLKNCSLIFPAL